MTKAYSREQVVARLSDYIALHGRMTTARRFGEQAQNLDQMVRGTRAPSPRVLAGLGIERHYVDAGSAVIEETRPENHSGFDRNVTKSGGALTGNQD